MRRVVSLLALLACNGPAGGEPAETWRYAVARADCAPWDGAAASVYLTDTPADSAGPIAAPLLRLSVYHEMAGVRGRRWHLGETGPDGAVAVYCDAGEACVSANAGWIEFSRGGQGTLAGQYEVTFPDGTRRAGRFAAPVQDILVLCG